MMTGRTGGGQTGENLLTARTGNPYFL